MLACARHWAEVWGAAGGLSFPCGPHGHEAGTAVMGPAYAEEPTQDGRAAPS